MKKCKKGISLIVLIISIIVIIILASTIMLTMTKGKSVSSANEATFKQDMLTIQDEYTMYLSNKYKNNPEGFYQSSVNLSGNKLVNELPSTNKYKDKISIVNGEITWIGKTENDKYYDWFTQVISVASNNEKTDDTTKNDDTTSGVEMKDGVPIPTGFKYKEGTKDTGLVIQDENGNEFVWVVANEKTYVKDKSFPYESCSSKDDDVIPTGIADEKTDVIKYGGFYIGRYEAGRPSSSKPGIPVSKKGATVWISLPYNTAKTSAESMISNSYVQTGLLTGTAWDTTCHWIEDSLSGINESATLTDSRSYGNYRNSIDPANTNNGSIKSAGSNENWKIKNIYDFAGNANEYTSEPSTATNDTFVFARGGAFCNDGSKCPVSYRYNMMSHNMYSNATGFRVRLYIKQ